MSDYIARPQDGAAWITGASSGIGLHLARALRDEGWTVYATARNGEDLAALATEADGPGRIVAAPGDVTDKTAMAALADEIGADQPIALLIPNAGIYLPMTAEDFDLDGFRKTVDVNVTGAANVVAPVMEKMIARGRGHIAVMASVAGYGGLPTSPAYGASKAALINMAESLKLDLDAAGVRVSVINPGFVDTPATRDNPFPMPFLMPAEDAARRIVAGLKRGGFELTFPRRFTWWLKLTNLLPYGLYFRAIYGFTGWKRAQRRQRR